MRYLGGKSRIAKKLVAAMAPVFGDTPVWDPFCGGLSVTCAMVRAGIKVVEASDINTALIILYKSVAAGWDPPRKLSRRDWAIWRDVDDSDPRKAFARFGCTFGGNWSSGYAYAGAENFAQESRNALLRDIPLLVSANVRLTVRDFCLSRPKKGLGLYLDPPYANTTCYPGAPEFQRVKFMSIVKQWGPLAPVFVSEYEFSGEVILDFSHNLQMGPNVVKNARRERLYRVR